MVQNRFFHSTISSLTKLSINSWATGKYQTDNIAHDSQKLDEHYNVLPNKDSLDLPKGFYYLACVAESRDLPDPDRSIGVASVKGASIRAPAQACAVQDLNKGTRNSQISIINRIKHNLKHKFLPNPSSNHTSEDNIQIPNC
jgi:hypothetical protein